MAREHPDGCSVILAGIPLIRRGIRRALDEAGGFQIVGETGQSGQVAPLIQEHRPLVVLIQSDLPGPSLPDVLRMIDSGATGVRTLVLEGLTPLRWSVDSKPVAADAFLTKTTDALEVVATLRRLCL